MATADVTTTTINPYEAARIQRMEECKRRFEDLGIPKISKSLSVATKAIKKSKRDCKKLKTMKMIVDALGTDLRRSSRPRTTVTIYSEEAAKEIRPSRKRSLPRSSARLDYEGRVCTETERKNAFKVAGNFQRNLLFESPSFINSMLPSHVYCGFWLGLPSKFCKNHLPTDRSEMVLEDDKGSECNSLYIGNKRGLSGGWRGFALSHNLEDGDALVFELVKHDRFKIYIFKANENGENNKADAADSAKSKRVKKVPVSADTSLTTSKNAQKASPSHDKLISGRHQQKGQSTRASKNTKGTTATRSKKDTGKNVTSSQDVQPANKSKSKKRAAVSENVEGSVSEVDDAPKSRKRGAATKTKVV